MCGIVGIIKLNARETVDEARLKRMRDVLRHRGPDGEGLWILVNFEIWQRIFVDGEAIADVMRPVEGRCGSSG